MKRYILLSFLIFIFFLLPVNAEAPFEILLKSEALNGIQSVSAGDSYLISYSSWKKALGFWNSEDTLFKLGYIDTLGEEKPESGGYFSDVCYYQTEKKLVLGTCNGRNSLNIFSFPDGKVIWHDFVKPRIDSYHSSSMNSGHIASIHQNPVLKISAPSLISHFHPVSTDDSITSYQYLNHALITGHQSGKVRVWSKDKFQKLQEIKLLNAPVSQLLIWNNQILVISNEMQYVNKSIVYSQIKVLSNSFKPIHTGEIPSFEKIEVRIHKQKLYLMGKKDGTYSVWQFRAGKWISLGDLPESDRGYGVFEPLNNESFLVADHGEASIVYLWKPHSKKLKNISGINRLREINRNKDYLIFRGESNFEVYSPRTGKLLAKYQTEHHDGTAPTALLNQYYVMGLYQYKDNFNQGFRKYQVWDLSLNKPVFISQQLSKNFSTFTIKNQFIYIGFEDGTIEQRELLSGKLKSRFKRHNQSIQNIEFFQNNMMTYAEEFHVRVDGFLPPKIRHEFNLNNRPISVFLSKEHLFIGDDSGILFIKDIVSGNELKRLSLDGAIHALAYSKPWVFAGSISGAIIGYNTQTGELKHLGIFKNLQKIKSNSNYLAISHDSKTALINLSNSLIEKNWGQIRSFDLTENNIYLATNHQIEVWDLKTLSLSKRIAAPYVYDSKFYIKDKSIYNLFEYDDRSKLKHTLFPTLNNGTLSEIPLLKNPFIHDDFLVGDYMEDWIRFVSLNDQKQTFVLKKKFDVMNLNAIKSGIIHEHFFLGFMKDEVFAKIDLKNEKIIKQIKLDSFDLDFNVKKFGNSILLRNRYGCNMLFIHPDNFKIIKKIDECNNFLLNHSFLFLEKANTFELLNTQFEIVNTIKKQDLEFEWFISLLENKYLLMQREMKLYLYDLNLKHTIGSIPLTYRESSYFYANGIIYILMADNSIDVWDAHPLAKIGTWYDFPSANLFISLEGFISGNGNFLDYLSFVSKDSSIPFEKLKNKYWQPERVNQIITAAMQN